MRVPCYFVRCSLLELVQLVQIAIQLRNACFQFIDLTLRQEFLAAIGIRICTIQRSSNIRA